MNKTLFDLLKGAFFGSIVSLTLFSSYAAYVNTNTILKLLEEPAVVEETIEEKIEKYKQFDQPHPSDSLFMKQRYTAPTITGTLL